MNFKKTLLSFSCLMAAPLVCSGFAAQAQTQAQTQAQEAETVPQTAAQADSADTKDSVVVTGSRIRRSNASSAVPLQVYSATDLEETGVTDLAEALIQLPGVREGIGPQGRNGLVQGNGLSNIVLRRLGGIRTLILINGKRAVSNSGINDQISLSTLPLGFVRRTEVTTGGASAVYGSGAIAGVTNFLLEDRFEGIRLDARYSAPEASGGDEYRINTMSGTRFANDRGHVLLGVSYRDRNPIVSDESRPLSLLPIEFDDPNTSPNFSFANEINQPGCDPQNEDRFCFLPSFDGRTPGGVFENGNAWFRDGQWFNNQSLQPADRTGNQGFYDDFDGFNTRPGSGIVSGNQTLAFGLHSTYELTPNIEAKFTGVFSDVDTTTINGFRQITNQNRLGDGSRLGNIPGNNPFIPVEVEEIRQGPVAFARRVAELGRVNVFNSRETYRFIGGLSGEIANKYNWEVFGTFGRFSEVQRRLNEVNLLNTRFALNVEADGAGGFQCANADARADGCVPLNLFGEGSISPEAADYIRYDGFSTQMRRQFTAGTSINGPVFELPSGTVQMAGGFEWRREEQNTVGDRDGDLIGGLDGDPTTPDVDVTTAATFPNLIADFEVFEGFAEIDIPVLRDRLSAQLALRVSDYETVGNIFSFNAGAVFLLNENIKFRGQFARSQRAPSLSEFFSAPRPGAANPSDPCNGLLPDGTGNSELTGNGADLLDLSVVAANCLAEPGVQQFFIDNPGSAFEFDDTVDTLGSGNQNLNEETANTITLGAVITPQAIPNFSLITDYYRIEINDLIGRFSTQNTINFCYAADDFPNNRFCDSVTRNPNDGTIEEIINFTENLDSRVVEGIDVALRYNFDTKFIPGNIGIDFRHTHYLTDLTILPGLSGDGLRVSALGEIGSPGDQSRLSVRFRDNNGFRISYNVTYMDGGIDDIINNSDPEDDRFFSVKGQAYHNVSLFKAFEVNNIGVTLSGGINNVFNKFGPLLPTGLSNGSPRNISNRLNDSVGRRFFTNLRLTF